MLSVIRKHLKTPVRKVIAILVLVLFLELVFVMYSLFKAPSPPLTIPSDLPQFTEAQLHEYDGSDPQKPIYIGLDGFVYDVSSGRKFYEPSGAYHLIAGTDASVELRVFGGDIIKEKYPIVGKLEVN